MGWSVEDIKRIDYSLSDLERGVLGSLEGSILVIPVWTGYISEYLDSLGKDWLGIEYRGCYYDLVSSRYNIGKVRKVSFIDGLGYLSQLDIDNVICFKLLNYYGFELIDLVLSRVRAKRYYFSCVIGDVLSLSSKFIRFSVDDINDCVLRYGFSMKSDLNDCVLSLDLSNYLSKGSDIKFRKRRVK